MPERSTRSPGKRASSLSPKRVSTGGAKKASTSKFVLGRERFAKISAVEGIALTPAMKKRAKEFDERGLSPAERRKEVLKLYRKKA